MGGAAHFRIVIIASLAGILFGFDTAVIAGVTSALREIFSLSPTGLGAAVSSASWTTLLGAFVIGAPRDLDGSRHVPRAVRLLHVLPAQRRALAWKHVARYVDSSPASPPVDPRCPRRCVSRKS